MKVSVWMITFNHEKYIRKALDSILMQKVNFDYEIVIGEDCSTDQTRSIVMEYHRKYPDIIKPIFHDKNVGTNANAIICLESCRGEYIAFLEGDDYWISDIKLQLQSDYLDAHPDCAYCFHNAIVRHENEEIEDKKILSSFVNKQFSVADILRRNYVPTASKMCRAASCADIPDFIYEITTADWFLNIHNLKFGTADYIDKVMSVYRISPSGISRDRVKIHSSAVKMFQYMYANADEALKPELIKAINLANESLLEELFSKVSRNIEAGNYSGAIQFLSQTEEISSKFPVIPLNLRQKKLLEKAGKTLSDADYDETEVLLIEALAIKGSSESIRSRLVLLLGDCYRKSGKNGAEASLYIDELSAGAISGIDSFGVLLRLGGILSTNGDFEASCKAYDDCLNIEHLTDSRRVDAHIGLSLCHKKAGKVDLTEEILSRIASLDYLSPMQAFHTYSVLADLFLTKNDLSKALEWLLKCQAIEGIQSADSANALLSLGDCYQRLGDFESAEHLFLNGFNSDLPAELRHRFLTRIGRIYISQSKADEFLALASEAGLKDGLNEERRMQLRELVDRAKNVSSRKRENTAKTLDHSEPFVSIVIPCYNAERTILGTLNSVYNCGYSNFEIVLVNDGSTDDTALILETSALKDPRLRVFHQPNRGVASARNAGVEYACSEYVAFLDADDIFYDGCITTRIDILLKEDSDQLLGVFCPSFLIDENLQPLQNKWLYDHKLTSDRLYFPAQAGCVFIPSSVIVKKRKFQSVGGFDPTLTPAEDYDLWHRMMRTGGYFRKTGDCFIGWMQHPASATHSGIIKHYNQKKKVIDRLFSETTADKREQLYKDGLGACYHLDTLSKNALSCALISVVIGEFDEALEIARDIENGYIERMPYSELWGHLHFISTKALCKSTDNWPFPLWNIIGKGVVDFLVHLSQEQFPHNHNLKLWIQRLSNIREADSTADTIELLSPDLIETNRLLADEIMRLSSQTGIGLGWHYLLDLIWIIKNVSHLPAGSVILDAGAGTGLLQFILADLGYKVVSADFAPRTPPERLRAHYRIVEVATKPVQSNEYIKHIENEFHSISSGKECLLSSHLEFESMIKEGAPGTIFYFTADIGKMSIISDGLIDCVVSLSALEHNGYQNLIAACQELNRVTKEEGLLVCTVSATDKSADWFHPQSKGWCYTEDTLTSVFGLDVPVSNFSEYSEIFKKLQINQFLKEHLAPEYFKTENNGMPWGIWNPQYQPVGIKKTRRDNLERVDPSPASGRPHATNYDRKAQLHPALAGVKISAFIDTTDGCNLRCSFCTRKNSKIEMMSSDRFDFLLSRIAPFVDNVQLCCAWEYSIAPNAHEIVASLGKYRFKTTSIYTNGQRLTDELANSIVRAQISNLVFSVGESKKETYEKLRIGGKFENVLNNIKKMKELITARGSVLPKLCSNLTVINSNIDEMLDFVDLAHHIGIAEIRGRHLILNQGLEVDDERILDLQRANRILDAAERKSGLYGMDFNIPRYSNSASPKNCKFPWSQIYIASNGDVSVCPRIHQYQKIGNIFNSDLRDILSSPELIDLQNQMKTGKFCNPVCGICQQNLETTQYIDQGF